MSSAWILPVIIAAAVVVLLPSCACACKKSHHPEALPRGEFTEIKLPGAGREWPVNVIGDDRGRPVLLLHELNGQSPGCLTLARDLARRGCQVYVPRFFGGYGSNHGLLYLFHLVLSPRWHVCSAHNTGRIRQDVKALADAVIQHNKSGRPLAVIGSCMSGALPLELLPEKGVGAVAMCQPAMPFFAWGQARKEALGLPAGTAEKAAKAMRDDPSKRLLSINYLDDKIGRIDRARAVARETAKAGVSHQHHIILGVGRDCCRSQSSTEGLPGAQLLPTCNSTGHSTVTGAPPGDVELYRHALYEALGLP